MQTRYLVALGLCFGILTVGCSSGGGSDDPASAPVGQGTSVMEADNGEPVTGPDAGAAPQTPSGGESPGEVDEAPVDAAALDAPRRWTIGPASFEVTGDLGTAQQKTDDAVVIVVGTTGFDFSNGPYSGANVTIVLSDAGSGVYTLTDRTTQAISSEDGTRVAALSSLAGSLQVNPLAATGWASTTSGGQLSVVVDGEGRYHVSTVEPVTLSREVDLGSGIPDSPDQILFEATNLHAAPVPTSTVTSRP